MRPTSAVRLVALALTTFMVSCDGSGITSPAREIDLAGTGTGANPGPNAAAILTGGFLSTAQPGVLRVCLSAVEPVHNVMDVAPVGGGLAAGEDAVLIGEDDDAAQLG